MSQRMFQTSCRGGKRVEHGRMVWPLLQACTLLGRTLAELTALYWERLYRFDSDRRAYDSMPGISRAEIALGGEGFLRSATPRAEDFEWAAEQFLSGIEGLDLYDYRLDSRSTVDPPRWWRDLPDEIGDWHGVLPPEDDYPEYYEKYSFGDILDRDRRSPVRVNEGFQRRRALQAGRHLSI
jgi:hypothetical protein